MGYFSLLAVCGRAEHSACGDVWCDELELLRLCPLGAILGHLANLVAGRRRGRVGHYPAAAFVDGRSAAELDGAAMVGGGRTDRVADHDGRSRLWTDFSYGNEKRSLDVLVHPVSHLGRV